MAITDTKELAKGYTAVNNTQFNAGRFLIEKLGSLTGNKILDIGCGTGNLTDHLRELVGEEGSVIGIDPSTERIAIAHEFKRSNLSFDVGRAEDLSRFPSGTFDVVFVNSTFHWVQDQPEAIREFSRVLKSGGRLGISGGSGDFVAIHEKIKEDVLSREPYRQYPEQGGPTFIKQRDLEKLLDQADFSKREIVVNTILKKAKDGADMVEWLDTSSSGATYGGIPLDLRPKAREEMKVEWAKVTTEDGICMPMELLVTVAVKN